MIIQVPPSGGKTYLTYTSEGFIDSDDLVRAIRGFSSYEDIEAIRNEMGLKELMTSLIQSALDQGDVLLTNFDTADFGFDVDAQVYYEPSTYVEHAIASDRRDLINGFGTATLRGWMNDAADRAQSGLPSYKLESKEYVSDIVANVVTDYQLSH